jgi:putative sigma-54 modulation protein
MQTANINVPVRVTARHMDLTESIKAYVDGKVDGLHLDYPRIIEAHVILDVNKHRHFAEVILHCSNHITIEATEECADMYAALDGVFSKIARRMRKYKTRMLRSHRPRRYEPHHFAEQVLEVDDSFPEVEDIQGDVPIVQTESYTIKALFVDEAVLQMQMALERDFLIFVNARTEKLSVVYRRRDGRFGLIEPNKE